MKTSLPAILEGTGQMTVAAPEVASTRLWRRNSGPTQADQRTFLSVVFSRFGSSSEPSRRWYDEGHARVVIAPGGQWSTRETVVNGLFATAHPGQADVIEESTCERLAHRAALAGAVA